MFRQHSHRHRDKETFLSASLLPLCDLPAGYSGTVVKISGGHEFMSRMAAIGFSPGAEVRVLQNHRHGPILTSVRESRLALGRGEAIKILIRVNHEPSSHT